MTYDHLTKKKKELDGYRPLPPALVRNLEEWFRVELTYTSNAIEGNTLTRRETAAVIEKGITVGGKSLREHLEATNHARALDVVNSMIKKKPSALTAHDILSIHGLILNGIDDTNAARYRNVPVRISGSPVVMPNPAKVLSLMEDFLRWLTTRNSLNPVAFAGEAHYRLVTIHPFVDGNGRTARLLMNLLLLMRGYPPQSSAPAIGSPISELSNARSSAAQGPILTLSSQRRRSGHWTSTSPPLGENPRKPNRIRPT